VEATTVVAAALCAVSSQQNCRDADLAKS